MSEQPQETKLTFTKNANPANVIQLLADTFNLSPDDIKHALIDQNLMTEKTIRVSAHDQYLPTIVAALKPLPVDTPDTLDLRYQLLKDSGDLNLDPTVTIPTLVFSRLGRNYGNDTELIDIYRYSLRQPAGYYGRNIGNASKLFIEMLFKEAGIIEKDPDVEP